MGSSHVSITGNLRACHSHRPLHPWCPCLGMWAQVVSSGSLCYRSPQRATGHLQSLARLESTAFICLRTGTTFTNQWLFEHAFKESPNRLQLGEVESISYILFFCSPYAKARTECGLGHFDADTSRDTHRTYLHPLDSRSHRRERRSILLNLLPVYGVLNRI